MKAINRRTIIYMFIATIVLLFVSWQIFVRITSAEPFTENDAKQLVQDMYNGEMIAISSDKEQFQVTIQLETGTYDIFIHRETGEINRIARVENPNDKQIMSKEEIKKLVQEQQSGDMQELQLVKRGKVDIYEAVVENENEFTTYEIDAFTGKMLSVTKVEKERTKPDDGKNLTDHGEQSKTTIPKQISEQQAIQIALQKVSGVVDDVDLEVEDGLSFYLVEIERVDGQEAVVQINSVTGEVMSIVWDD